MTGFLWFFRCFSQINVGGDSAHFPPLEDAPVSLALLARKRIGCDRMLLNIQGNMKNSLNTRQDLAEMGIQVQLHPRSNGKKIYLPPACHTLSRKEKISFCQCLCRVKDPQGYSSNIKSLVQLKDLKLVGLESHNCHVLMQQLLAMSTQDILPNKARLAITRLCFFFSAICNKVLDPVKLDELENETAIILCQLEMYFLLLSSTSWSSLFAVDLPD